MRRFSRRSLGGVLQNKCEQYEVVPNAEGQIVGQLIGAPRPHYSTGNESYPLRKVHLSRHKWPGGSVKSAVLGQLIGTSRPHYYRACLSLSKTVLSASLGPRALCLCLPREVTILNYSIGNTFEPKMVPVLWCVQGNRHATPGYLARRARNLLSRSRRARNLLSISRLSLSRSPSEDVPRSLLNGATRTFFFFFMTLEPRVE